MALLVHEVNPGIGSSRYPEPLSDFGYGQPDCRVHNYWDEDPPLQLSDPQCRWLLLKRKGRLMVLLCTWNP
jgi:hypothetical protein